MVHPTTLHTLNDYDARMLGYLLDDGGDPHPSQVPARVREIADHLLVHGDADRAWADEVDREFVERTHRRASAEDAWSVLVDALHAL